MNSTTKIVVLQGKQLIAGILIALLIAAAICIMAILNREKDTVTVTPSGKYAAGVYSSSVTLGGNPVEVRITVDEDNLNNIELVNISESVTTMYPLIQSSFQEIRELVMKNGGVEGVASSTDNRYTSTMLLKAIKDALEKCEN